MYGTVTVEPVSALFHGSSVGFFAYMSGVSMPFTGFRVPG